MPEKRKNQAIHSVLSSLAAGQAVTARGGTAEAMAPLKSEPHLLSEDSRESRVEREGSHRMIFTTITDSAHKNPAKLLVVYFLPVPVRMLYKGEAVLWNGNCYQVDDVSPPPPGVIGTITLRLLDRGQLARSEWSRRPRTSIRFSYDDMFFVLTQDPVVVLGTRGTNP